MKTFWIALTILVLATPSRAWAQPEAHPATLDVCNKGNVPVAAAVATKKGLPPISDYWIIEGIPIAAGACKRIYSTSFADTAYVGFGFADAQGRWTSGTVDDVPDFGSHYYGPVEAALKGALSRPVLNKSEKTLCVRREPIKYSLEKNPQTNCENLHVNGQTDDRGKYLAVTAFLYFDPVGQSCSRVENFPTTCSGGDYYLSIAPGAVGTALHALLMRPDGTIVTAADQAKAKAEERAFQDDIRRGVRERQEIAQARLEAAKKKADQEMRRSVADFAPQWIGQRLIVKGTVSRVEGGRLGNLFFQESPDVAIAVCGDAPMLTPDLVGKIVEVEGVVKGPGADMRGAPGPTSWGPSPCKGTKATMMLSRPPEVRSGPAAAAPNAVNTEAPRGRGGAGSASTRSAAPPAQPSAPAAQPTAPADDGKVGAGFIHPPGERAENGATNGTGGKPPADDDAPPAGAGSPRPAARAAQPAPPPIPMGTQLTITTLEPVDLLNSGDRTYRAQLERPATYGRETVLPAGAEVLIKVSRATSPARSGGLAMVSIGAESTIVGGKRVTLTTSPVPKVVPASPADNPGRLPTLLPAGSRLVLIVRTAVY